MRGQWSLFYKRRGSAFKNSVHGLDTAKTQTHRVSVLSVCILCCQVIVWAAVYGLYSLFLSGLGNALRSFIGKSGVCGQAKEGLGVLSQGCVRQRRVKENLLARLSAQHTADGEERPAWLGAPGSRQTFLEQVLWAPKSGCGLPSPSLCKTVHWPCSCVSVQREMACLNQTTSSLQKREPQKRCCTDEDFVGTGFFDKTFFFQQ